MKTMILKLGLAENEIIYLIFDFTPPKIPSSRDSSSLQKNAAIPGITDIFCTIQPEHSSSL